MSKPNKTRQDENERIAATINRVWGERVAWVEERYFCFVCKRTKEEVRMTIPVVVSSLVGGRIPGRVDPPFFAGPAPSGGGR